MKNKIKNDVILDFFIIFIQMLKILLIIATFFISICALAQNNKQIEELETLLKTEATQEETAETLLSLSILYQNKDLESGITYLQNIDKAIEYAQQSIDISDRIHYTTKKIKAIHQLGRLYRLKKDFKKALAYHNQGLKIAQDYSNQKSIANAYINIGKVYHDADEEELAKTYFLKAIDLGNKIKNPLIKYLANTSLGDLNDDLARKNIAVQFYLEALDNILQTNNSYLQGIAYKKVALNTTYENRLEMLKKALHKFEQIDDKKELAEINFFLGEYYQKIKDYDKAIIYMKNSLGFSELSGHQEFIKKGYENIALVYEKNKDYKNAYDYLGYYSAIKGTKVISELEAQIELEKKNKEIALNNQRNSDKLKAERTRTYVLFSVALLILIFSFILYFNLRQKNKMNIELKKATLLANNSKKEKEEFFAYTSHEIRTPLNAVVGMTQLLGNTNLNEIQTKYLKTIKSSAKNILFLVNDVLDLAKLEKGAIVLEHIDTSLREIISEIEGSLSFKTKEKNVSLKTFIDPKLPDYIKADPLRLNQILLNLTDNALKFTNEGEVQVKLTLQKETKDTVQICFQVIDTGIGISEEKISSIFDNYQQASVDTTRRYGGTGLGLAITKQLIALMHSEIKIESEVGKGSTFKFKVTFDKSNQKTAVKNSLENTEYQAISNLTILAVDDTALNRSIFYELVHSKENNIEVYLAENGKEAVEWTLKKKFDVIVMDLQMPVLNGFEATKEIRTKQNLNQNTPIIAMTAHAVDGVSKRCDEAGMNDYISKPINLSVLFNKIATYTNQTENEKTIENNKPELAIVTETVNLESLYELLRGKKEKLIKYIDLYLINVPKDFKELKQEFELENWENCAKIAHKIKGTAGYMGVEKAKEILIEIEKNKDGVAKENKNNDIVCELEKVLKKAASDLEQIKNNLIT